MITVMLHKMNDRAWTDEELSPIKNIEILDVTPSFSALGAIITLSDDKIYEIDFRDIDGKRAC